jgi:hypothetical protein
MAVAGQCNHREDCGKTSSTYYLEKMFGVYPVSCMIELELPSGGFRSTRTFFSQSISGFFLPPVRDLQRVTISENAIPTSHSLYQAPQNPTDGWELASAARLTLSNSHSIATLRQIMVFGL